METSLEHEVAAVANHIRLDRHLGYNLRQVSNLVSGEFARALRLQDTSVAEWVVLCHLQQGQAMGPGELAETLALTPGAVSKVLAKLEEKHWIARETRAGDNRAQVVSLSRAGRAALPQMVRIADGNDEKFFNCLDKAERKTLRRLLHKLQDAHAVGTVAVD